MGYKRFEDLPVWNTAIELSVRLFEMTGTGGLNNYAGLKSQIERAAVSVSNNIAEGFDRGTHEELLTFLYYAMGSAGEVRSMLLLIQRLPGSVGLRPQVTDLVPLAMSVSRQLGAWIESLKNSNNRGPRYRNEETRTAADAVQRRNAFLVKMERIKHLPRNIPGQPFEDS